MGSSRKKVDEFYKRWNIPLDADKEFQRFRNRVIIAIDRTVGRYILQTPAVADAFVLHVGHNMPPISVVSILTFSDFEIEKKFKDSPIFVQISSVAAITELIFALQCLCWSLQESNCSLIEDLVQNIRKAIDASPTLIRPPSVNRQNNARTILTRFFD